MQTLFIILLSTLSVFMILLILIQRGKGGGLAGAFGGMGGQSAFGTKAGDAFTKITVIVAICWFILCILSIWDLRREGQGKFKGFGGGTPASVTVPADTSTTEETGSSISTPTIPAETSVPGSAPAADGAAE